MSNQATDAKETTESGGNSRAQPGSNTGNTRSRAETPVYPGGADSRTSRAEQYQRTFPDVREQIALALLADAGWSVGELRMTFQADEGTIRRELEKTSTVLYGGGQRFHRVAYPNDEECGVPICESLQGDYVRVPQVLVQELLGAQECAHCFERRERP